MSLMKDRNKQAATLIIRKMKGSEDADGMVASNSKMSHAVMNENGDEVDSDMGLSAAAEEVMVAVKKEDKAGLMNALKSFVEMAMMEADNSKEYDD